MLLLVIILPIIYFFVSIFLMIYYCKYKKVRNQYQVLKGELEETQNYKN
jgi:hypothetical protein